MTNRLQAKAISTGIALFCAAMLGLAGCQQTSTTAEAAPQPDSEFDQGTPAPAPRRAEPVQVASMATIYFDFDRYDIRDDARPVLRSNAEILKQTGARVTLGGHCDERGSEEYNLALGERRANSVKKYLVDLGVSGSNLRSVSYGEAKPASPGHGEAAWRYNRRVEFTEN